MGSSYIFSAFKVQIFWEGHKKLKKIFHFVLTCLSNFKNEWDFFFKFCGLLIISELYISFLMSSKDFWTQVPKNSNILVKRKSVFSFYIKEFIEFEVGILTQVAKSSLTSESFSPWLKSPKKCFKSLSWALLN